MDKITISREFTGYGVIDDIERYERNIELNNDRDLLIGDADEVSPFLMEKEVVENG